MPSVIVTVKTADTAGKDFEIPADMPTINIIRFLAEPLGLPPNTAAVMYRIKAENLGRYLGMEETLENAGVYDGEILSIIK